MPKPIVCTALMTLLQKGRFSLFDPAACYIPAFASTKVLADDGTLVEPSHPNPVGDLVAHTSGLAYHFIGDAPVPRA